MKKKLKLKLLFILKKIKIKILLLNIIITLFLSLVFFRIFTKNEAFDKILYNYLIFIVICFALIWNKTAKLRLKNLNLRCELFESFNEINKKEKEIEEIKKGRIDQVHFVYTECNENELKKEIEKLKQDLVIQTANNIILKNELNKIDINN